MYSILKGKLQTSQLSHVWVIIAQARTWETWVLWIAITVWSSVFEISLYGRVWWAAFTCKQRESSIDIWVQSIDWIYAMFRLCHSFGHEISHTYNNTESLCCAHAKRLWHLQVKWWVTCKRPVAAVDMRTWTTPKIPSTLDWSIRLENSPCQCVVKLFCDINACLKAWAILSDYPCISRKAKDVVVQVNVCKVKIGWRGARLKILHSHITKSQRWQ